MNALGLLKIILTLANTIAGYLRDKRLMDAGAAESVLKGLQDANEAISRARAAGDAAVSVPIESDPDDRAKR